VAGTVFEAMPWSEQTEVVELQKLDIGIMPLPDEPWERGKCGYKLIQYMALGLPVVASPVGANRQIVQDGVNGFLASMPLEWKAALAKLLENASQRRQMGATGRQCVEKIYSLHVQASRLIAMLEQIASKRPS
jgi:glycosyltransferase involved in cell wall biosynthesis